MDNCYGQHGWKEFHRNRKDILAEFDKILEQTENRPIQVAHGQGVEAYIRKWLAEFLPKKYAVTSGYIIPDLYEDNCKIYHFDIIIYNCLEAPVLWTEGSQDNSEQGKYRAIPAKHVIAVYEVKSRFTKTNVTDALNKLDQTKDFNEQLSANYSCGAIFIDLKESDKNRESILKELCNGANIYGFSGGLVLRYEGDDTPTGLITFFKNEPTKEEKSNNSKPLAKVIDDLDIYLNEEGSLEIAEQGGGADLLCTKEHTWSVTKSYSAIYNEGPLSVYLSWSRSNFSEFCIDLLSALEGLPHNDEKRPSFGRIFDKVEHKPATPIPDLPFLNVVSTAGPNGEKNVIYYEEDVPTIEFWIEVENQSEVEVTISDDRFKTKCNLAGGKKAIKSVKVGVKRKDEDSDFDVKKLLKEEGLELLYRLVYFPMQGEKKFFAIEKKVKISDSEIEFL